MLDVVVNSEKLMLFPLFKKTLTKPLVPTKSTTIHNKTLKIEKEKKRNNQNRIYTQVKNQNLRN